MTVAGTPGLPVAALGGGKVPGWGPVGLPCRSVTGGAGVPGGLVSAADGGVGVPAAGGWLGAVVVAAFGCGAPAGDVVAVAGLP